MIGEDDPFPFESERGMCVIERERSGCRFV